MRKTPLLLLTLLASNFLFAQRKFSIELDAPSFIKNDLIFSPPFIRIGFKDLYIFKVDTNKNIIDFGQKYGFAQCTFKITIQEKNIIKGEINYPIPITFQRFNPQTKLPELTKTFFLDSGSYKIELPEQFNSYDLKINSPINNEYLKFKKLFSDLYVKPKIENSILDSLIDLTKKEKRIGDYIKTNSNSYVALWEIVNDYNIYNYNPIYLNNLKLFSNSIKKTRLFKILESKFRFEDSTIIGKEFPEMNFDNQNKLTKQNFKNNKLTFIDYWSTTCLPCIREMPEIVALYEKYKEKGINFITVTDEKDPKRIAIAKRILDKNKVIWKKYYDTKKEFNRNLNVTAYPLHILIDQNGKIIARTYGNLNEIKSIIDEKLQ